MKVHWVERTWSSGKQEDGCRQCRGPCEAQTRERRGECLAGADCVGHSVQGAEVTLPGASGCRGEGPGLGPP